MAIRKNLNKKAFLDIKMYGESDTMDELLNSTDVDLNGKFFRVLNSDYPLIYRVKQGFLNTGFAPGLAMTASAMFLMDMGISLRSLATEVSMIFRADGSNYFYFEGYNCFRNALGVIEKTNPLLGAHLIEKEYNDTTKKTTIKTILITSNAAVNPTSVTVLTETLDHIAGTRIVT